MEEKTNAQEQLEAVQELNFINRDYGSSDPNEMDMTILSQTAEQMKVKIKQSNPPNVEGTALNADTLNILKNAAAIGLEQSIEALEKSNVALNAVEQKQGTAVYKNGQYLTQYNVDEKADKIDLENYYKKTGGNINGRIVVNPSYDSSNGSYIEGVRINKATNGWAGVYLAGPIDSISDAADEIWTIARRGSDGTISGHIGDLTLECGDSNGNGLTLYKDGRNPTWQGKSLTDGMYHIQLSGHAIDGDRYYALAIMPSSNGGTFDSVVINGIFGGWNSKQKCLLNCYVGNRDETSGAASLISNNLQDAFQRVDIKAYKQSDGSTILYLQLKSDEYYTVDFYVHLLQSSYVFDGTYTTDVPAGEKVWSLESSGVGKVYGAVFN